MANKVAKQERRKNRKAPEVKPFDPVREAQERVDAADDARALDHEKTNLARKRIDARPAIERYFDRKAIDHIQKAAADRLLADFSASGLTPRVVADYGQSGGGGGGGGKLPLGPKMLEFSGALRAVGFPLTLVLWAVVIEDKAADKWSVSIGRKPDDGIAALRFALDALARHYKFVGRGYGEVRSPAMAFAA